MSNIDKILNQIKETRAQNNDNWMDLLRLAFKIAPYNAKIIMRKIIVHDEKIKNLCKDLIDEG